MNIVTVFEQMLVLFVMILTGVAAHRKGWVSEELYSGMSRLVVNIFNPLLIVSSVLGKTSDSAEAFFRQNLFLVFVFYIWLFVGSLLFVAVTHPDRKESPIYQLLILFPNTGFMGIPLVAALLGSEYVIYVAIYMLGYNLLIYTYGIHLARRSAQNTVQECGEMPAPSFPALVWGSLRPVLTNPGVAAAVVAMILFFSGCPVPAWIAKCCDYMGNASIPLSMFLIGCSVAASSVGAMLHDVRVYFFLAFRMFLLPIGGILLARLLPVAPQMQQLFGIMLAMPAGSLVVLIAQQYGEGAECATRGVILSTLLSLVSIPVVSLFL